MEDHFLPDSMTFVNLDFEPIWGYIGDIPEDASTLMQVGDPFLSMYKV